MVTSRKMEASSGRRDPPLAATGSEGITQFSGNPMVASTSSSAVRMTAAASDVRWMSACALSGVSTSGYRQSGLNSFVG